MLHVLKIIITLSSLNFLMVICLIPDLSVQMLDKRLIQRKRQDTLEMCRLFNAETEKLNILSEGTSFKSNGKRRFKRETGAKPSNGEVEKAKRVENIVDKLYEDLEENGEQVTYMHNPDTVTTAADKEVVNKTIRRFNFAPAVLLGPRPTERPAVINDNDDEPAGGLDWPKKWKHGIVPYYIDSKTYDAELAELIMKAFDYFEKATCIRLQRLKDRPTDQNSLQNVEWLYVTNPNGIRQCVHSNERKVNKGVQMVVFGYDCMSLGEIVHEVMHILGFSHEHTRPDRDQYITILWNNIKPGYKKYFEARTSDNLMNIPYDHASVLHYPPRAFSKNGQITVMAAPGIKLGQRDGLSEGDVDKVGVIYGHECMARNRQYLLKTCPSVVRAETGPTNVTQKEIVEYFKDRLWPFGVVNYKLRDTMEFSLEERENIRAVIRHIEKETCIRFKDISSDLKSDENVAHDRVGNIQADIGPEEAIGGTDNDDHAAERSPKLSDNEISLKDDEPPETNPSIDDNPALRKGTENDTVKTPDPEKVGQYFNKTFRRHASDILVLARSTEPGCACPTPGRPNGNKVLHINADCFNSVNDLLHLFVHVLGLDHQHNTYDRDSYLHILWENLTPEIKEEMQTKLPPAASMGYDYDYQSVMHYPWLQIKNGVTNIMYPIWNDGWAMGHWQGLSSTDVFKLNLIYFEQCYAKRNEKEE